MTAARPILIVENDHDQREILVRNLNLCNEFEISVAATFSQADALLGTKDARFDAIILGLGMPDGTGYDYLAELRRQGRNMPIIIVTDSCNEADIVRGLDAGASDYMTKPLRLNLSTYQLQQRSRVAGGAEVFGAGWRCAVGRA